MYAFELFEAGKPRVIVTYPGRFQPFHQGHAAVYAQLQKKFGRDNVYILTSNDTSGPKSPFSFSDKYQLMTAAGVPGDRIIETTNMYALPEGFDKTNTIFIAAVGEPDKKRLNPDSALKKDKKDAEGNVIKPAGSPGYFLSFDRPEPKVSADQHGYVIVIPEVKKTITIKGKQYDVSHGTECRNLWNAIRNDQKARIEFLTQLYGQASSELAHIFDKIPTVAEDVVAVSQDTTSPVHGGITESVLNENEEYVLYLNGKASAQYTDTGRLKADLMHLKKKYPNLQYEIRKEVCKEVPVTTIAEATYLRIGDVTDKIKAAVSAAKQLNAKVVKTAGGYFKVAPLDDPRPAIDINPTYFDNLKKYQDQLKKITRMMRHIERQYEAERPGIFRELDKRFPDSRGRTMDYDEPGAKWLNSALHNLQKKYYGTEEYKTLAKQKKQIDDALEKLRDEGNRSQEKTVAEDIRQPDVQGSYSHQWQRMAPVKVPYSQKQMDAIKSNTEYWKQNPVKKPSNWDPKYPYSGFYDKLSDTWAVAPKSKDAQAMSKSTPNPARMPATPPSGTTAAPNDEYTANMRQKVQQRSQFTKPPADLQRMPQIDRNRPDPVLDKNKLPFKTTSVIPDTAEVTEDNNHSLSERQMMRMVKRFMHLAAKELKLNKLPRIEVQPHLESHDGQATFGRFVNEEEKIYLGVADRHPVDILRTLAHELVHFKQYEQGRIKPDSGETGSAIENEAHAVAGVLMRHFNKKYPDAIKSKPLELGEAKQEKCPPATQDITLNLKNRQKAIDEYGYGPLNPDLPNTKFWMKKVDEWNLDSADEAKQSLCGNCAAFDVRQSTLDCIAQGIDSDSPQDAEGVIDAGDLGYCKFLKFKCASRRTCDAWVTGGPLTDRVDEKWSEKYKSSINCSNPKGFSQKAHCAGRKKNEDVAENFADGRNPQDKGDSKRYNVPTKGSISSLRKIAKQGGRRGQLAHWMANMKSGKKKND